MENEELTNKNSGLQLKFLKLEDDVVDKEELCQQYQEKLGVLEQEIREIGESNEELLFKIKQYEDTGAILPQTDDEDRPKPESQI